MAQATLQQPTLECRDAFERYYSCAWSDAAQIDNRVIWMSAWQSAAAEIKEFAEKLRTVEFTSRIGDFADAQKTAAAFDQCAKFLLTND